MYSEGFRKRDTGLQILGESGFLHSRASVGASVHYRVSCRRLLSGLPMRPPKPGNNSFRPWASCRQRDKVLDARGRKGNA